MNQVVQQWLVPILLVIPVAVGLFVVGSRLDRGARRPVDQRTRPDGFDPAPMPGAGGTSVHELEHESARRRVEPTLH